jgi:hypothetical protein
MVFCRRREDEGYCGCFSHNFHVDIKYKAKTRSHTDVFQEFGNEVDVYSKCKRAKKCTIKILIDPSNYRQIDSFHIFSESNTD